MKEVFILEVEWAADWPYPVHWKIHGIYLDIESVSNELFRLRSLIEEKRIESYRFQAHELLESTK